MWKHKKNNSTTIFIECLLCFRAYIRLRGGGMPSRYYGVNNVESLYFQRVQSFEAEG